MLLITPVVPLKNYHTGYLAHPNGIRDTPLVPGGTVADIYIICMHSMHLAPGPGQPVHSMHARLTGL